MFHELRARRGTTLAAIVALTFWTGCSGGGGSAPSTSRAPANPAPANGNAGSAGTLAVTFPSKTNATVTVSHAGAQVASGTLDAHGAASLALPASVGRGTTVTASSSGIAATFVLAFATPQTLATVTDNGDGTISVSVHDGGGGENQSVTEDRNGDPVDVDEGDMPALPANLPIAISATCTDLSLAATSAQVAFIDFEEKASDGESDGNAEIRVTGLPFSTTANDPLVEPVVAGAARIEIRVYDATHRELLRVRGPIGSFTALANGGAMPTACPAAQPSASASPTARASESPEPEASESPEPGESAEPSPSPSSSNGGGGGPGPH